MDSADWKQEKRLYFIMLCGQNSRILWQRLTLSLITLYSEGCVIEMVGAFLSELPKGQPIKCFNYGVRRRKTGEKVIFSSCCGGESGIFYGRGLSCLLSTPYSEKRAFQRVFCWRTLWLKHFTDSLWGCPNYFPLARTAPSLFVAARNQTSIVWPDKAFRIRFIYASFSFFIAETT